MNNLKNDYIFIGYTNYYEKSLKSIKELVQINNSPSAYHKGILKIISRVHFSTRINKIIPLPFKFIWINDLIRCKKNDGSVTKPKCFILQGSNSLTYIPGLVNSIRKKYKDSTIVLECTDKVDFYCQLFGQKRFRALSRSCDLVVTYNKVDSLKYGFPIFPPVLLDYSIFEPDETIPRSDLLFVGMEKGRLDILHKIYTYATNQGLICDFTIIGVPREKRLKESQINYDQYLPYETVIQKIKKTNCILNISQEGANGLTLRDLEAIGNKKFLMTNDQSIRQSPLFNEEQIIIIENVNNIDLNRIRAPYRGNSIDITQFSWMNRLIWLDEKIEVLIREE